MDEKKRNLRDTMFFLFAGALSGAIIAMIASDTLKIQEYKGQIVQLQQEVAVVQKKLETCGK